MGNPPKKKSKSKSTKLSLVDHDEAIKEIKEDLVQLSSAEKAISDTIAKLEKAFGKGIVQRFDGSSIVKVNAISTGSIGLDYALGIGGLPRGRVIEIFGQESSGKTTLALHVVANTQKVGGTCVYIDLEHAIDPTYAKNIGVSMKDLLLVQPDYGEQALEVANYFASDGSASCIVIDSVAALVPKAELEGDMGDIHVGLQARLMSQAMRKLTGTVSKSNTLVIFINQLRDKIGVMYGPKTTTTGGNALKFYASVRIEIKRLGAVKAGKDISEAMGNRVLAKVIKNKMAPPFREAEFDIMYGKGINYEADLTECATKLGIISQNGTWMSYADTRLGQGRLQAAQYIKENPQLIDKIKQDILHAQREL